ncbi:conserved hypothetical protein [Culex quinquefasciatus]|uniref:Av71 muscle cell intermediate filament n=1 Tax=Culex quinquefasciatus TaxID=7176 RepID=B0VZM4_CULQU|nr:conserved hypothetical protein [Culex quinquefasciatus]|eukprot:XP_001841908.1 conserved hypothetical protein [Culex quinquefasciatus]
MVGCLETYHQNKELNAQSHRVSGFGTAAGKPVTCHHVVGIRDTCGTLHFHLGVGSRPEKRVKLLKKILGGHEPSITHCAIVRLIDAVCTNATRSSDRDSDSHQSPNLHLGQVSGPHAAKRFLRHVKDGLVRVEGNISVTDRPHGKSAAENRQGKLCYQNSINQHTSVRTEGQKQTELILVYELFLPAIETLLQQQQQQQWERVNGELQLQLHAFRKRKSRKQETRNKKQETRNKKQETRNKKQETRNKKQETRNKKQETRNKKQETRNKKQETRNKKQETRNKKQETRNKKQETRNKKQETRNKKQETRNKKHVHNPESPHLEPNKDVQLKFIHNSPLGATIITTLSHTHIFAESAKVFDKFGTRNRTVIPGDHTAT